MKDKPDILPNSVPHERKNIVFRGGVPWVPIFCANCGVDGGWIPEEACDFASYLCDPCAIKWGPSSTEYLMPDEVFWEKVKQAQLEKYGRELSAEEVMEQLKISDSMISKLARDRKG